MFTRQVFLGETLDPEHMNADYTTGVLTLSIPVRESAKPRKVEITSQDAKQLNSACARLLPVAAGVQAGRAYTASGSLAFSKPPSRWRVARTPA